MNVLKIFVVAVCLCTSAYSAPAKDGKDGKSAQNNNRVSFGSKRDSDRDSEHLLNRNRDNDRLHNRDRDSFLGSSLHHNSIHTGTPQPQIITVSTPQPFLPSQGVGGVVSVDPFDRRIINTVPSIHGGVHSGIHGSSFPSSVDSSSIFLLAQDPNRILRNPQLLIIHPQLALMHRTLILQYPQLRHYVSPFVLGLLDQRFSTNHFNRVFPSTVVGNPSFVGQDFGNHGFRGHNFGSNIGNSVLDINRPIDIGRPVFATTISPVTFSNPNHSIRFQK